jgi:hypothetical protein
VLLDIQRRLDGLGETLVRAEQRLYFSAICFHLTNTRGEICGLRNYPNRQENLPTLKVPSYYVVALSNAVRSREQRKLLHSQVKLNFSYASPVEGPSVTLLREKVF